MVPLCSGPRSAHQVCMVMFSSIAQVSTQLLESSAGLRSVRRVVTTEAHKLNRLVGAWSQATATDLFADDSGIATGSATYCRAREQSSTWQHSHPSGQSRWTSSSPPPEPGRFVNKLAVGYSLQAAYAAWLKVQDKRLCCLSVPTKVRPSGFVGRCVKSLW